MLHSSSQEKNVPLVTGGAGYDIIGDATLERMRMSLDSHGKKRVIETPIEAKLSPSNESDGTDDGNLFDGILEPLPVEPRHSGRQNSKLEPPRREDAGSDHSTDNDGSEYGSEDEIFDIPKPNPINPKSSQGP
jgi:hypothetical protein